MLTKGTRPRGNQLYIEMRMVRNYIYNSVSIKDYFRTPVDD